MDDLISRQMAIDALTDYCENKCVNREDAWCSGCHYGVSEYVLKALPSAQPQKCSDILDELKADDYYNYIHTGYSRFSEDDWDYIIHNAKEKEKLHERLDIKTDGD